MFAYLTVTGADGSPVANLADRVFTLSENGKNVPPTAVRAVTLGVQTVFALDVGPTFKTRDLRGNSRLDYLRLGIGAFAQAADGLQPSLDDISLITPEQELLIHASTRGPMVDALDRYTTEFAGATDHVALLTRAIDIAGNQPAFATVNALWAYDEMSIPATVIPGTSSRRSCSKKPLALPTSSTRLFSVRP